MNLSFPTSIAVLAGYLLKFQISCQVWDEQIQTLSPQLLAKLLSQLTHPKVVGLSSVTLTASRCQELAAMIKSLDASVTILVGGIHATVLPEDFLANPHMDLVVRGEGELTLKEILDHLLAGQDPRQGNIQGISYRSPEGKFIHQPDRPLLKDLDEIPPMPYHLFAQHKEHYSNFGILFGSRGCPYPCTFCSARSISGTKYRFHSVERMVSEAKRLVEEYQQPLIHLADDNIAVHKRHFKELCQGIIDAGLHHKAAFHGSLRGDDATDEILAMARQANFTIIYFGLETGSERLMEVIRKKEKVQEVVDAIHRAHQHGLAVGTTLIFGLPSETREERQSALQLVHSLPLASVRFNTLAPYPGTAVYQEYFPQGKVLVKPGWANFNVQYMWESDEIPFVPDGTNRVELIFDTMYANLPFYLSWHGIRQVLSKPVAGGNVVHLGERWYTQLPKMWKMFLLFQYLMRRFAGVALRYFLFRLRPTP
ncbi:MAG: radical SAM protein [Magnetococcales bacterium]|nr:radical SAM protein [Magnetococcales bacterium]